MLRRPMRNPFVSPLWQNRAFVRVWSAATVSIFGSLITRIALPLVAILSLGAGPIEVALLRTMDLLATFVVGLFVGAWVDRLRRRPVLIWADVVGRCSSSRSRSPSRSGH
jgi:MFS family permease